MNVQSTPAYRKAWASYVQAGYDVDKLSAADREALREDPTTRANIDAARPTVVASPRPAAASPPWPDFDEVMDDLVAAMTATLDNDKASSFVLPDVFLKHAGETLTPRASFIRDAMLRIVADGLLVALSALRSRVKALEAKPAITYKGTWDQQAVYAVGNACTFAGSLWIARTANTSRRPGAGDGCWQLATKRGADGTCRCRCAAGDKDPT